MDRFSKAGIIILALIWAGMLIGLSFIEAPLKFQAPGVTTLIGVGIGNLVFHALNKVEIIFMLLILAFYFFSEKGRPSLPVILLVSLILILQIGWLMPKLDSRVALIQSGITPPASQLHFYYVFGEISKLILLLTLGIRQIIKVQI